MGKPWFWKTRLWEHFGFGQSSLWQKARGMRAGIEQARASRRTDERRKDEERKGRTKERCTERREEAKRRKRQKETQKERRQKERQKERKTRAREIGETKRRVGDSNPCGQRAHLWNHRAKQIPPKHGTTRRPARDARGAFFVRVCSFHVFHWRAFLPPLF